MLLMPLVAAGWCPLTVPRRMTYGNSIRCLRLRQDDVCEEQSSLLRKVLSRFDGDNGTKVGTKAGEVIAVT